MKAMSKKIVTLVLVLAFACVGLVGCGAISIDEIKGDWTLDTIDGKSLADYAAETGVTEDFLYSNWTINDDKTVSSSSALGEGKLSMELKSNGFEAKDDASGINFSVEYNKDAGTLTYKMDAGTGAMTYVMKKGTYTPSEAEEDTEEASEEDAEAADEESDEEYVDEESDEDLGEDEEYAEEEDYSEEEEAVE